MAGESGVTGAGATGPAAVPGVTLPAGAFAPATPTTGLAGMNSGPFWPQPARTNRVAPATQAIRHSLRERFGSPAASDGGKHG